MLVPIHGGCWRIPQKCRQNLSGYQFYICICFYVSILFWFFRSYSYTAENEWFKFISHKKKIVSIKEIQSDGNVSEEQPRGGIEYLVSPSPTPSPMRTSPVHTMSNGHYSPDINRQTRFSPPTQFSPQFSPPAHYSPSTSMMGWALAGSQSETKDRQRFINLTLFMWIRSRNKPSQLFCQVKQKLMIQSYKNESYSMTPDAES